MTLTAVAKVLSDPRLKPILQTTSKTVHKLSNNTLLTEIPQKPFISKEDYFSMLMTYAKSHRRVREKGEKGWIKVENGENEKEKNTICWLDENLDPMTGLIPEYFLCFLFRCILSYFSLVFYFSIFLFFYFFIFYFFMFLFLYHGFTFILFIIYFFLYVTL